MDLTNLELFVTPVSNVPAHMYTFCVGIRAPGFVCGFFCSLRGLLDDD